MIVPFLLVFMALGGAFLVASIARSHLVGGLEQADNQPVAEQLEVREGRGLTVRETELDLVLQRCTDVVVELGFDAAWLLVDGARTPAMSVGDWRCAAPAHAISATRALFSSDPGDVLITSWKNSSPSNTRSSTVQLHSASAVMSGPSSTGHVVLLGWSQDPVSDVRADAFGALARSVSQALATEGPILDLRSAPAPRAGQVERVDKKVARSPSF